jgi:chloramphenicol-sensitive protein RarD
MKEQDQTQSGLLFGLGCYVIWGFFPIYWKFLEHVPSLEILAHRMVWSLGFVAILLALRGRWAWLRETVRKPRLLGIYSVAAALLALNWGVYIWAVNAGVIVETSLGYFINPLINVVFGALFLGERPRPVQWGAIGLAAAGVAYLTWAYGQLPWIALVLAVSFATYGLLKKKASLGAVEGLSVETAVLFFPALAYLLYLEGSGVGSFGHSDAATPGLLAFTGIATALPLVFFAAAIRRLTLTAIGILQYLAPTTQFLIGVFLYDEPFSIDRLIGFVFIWVALIVFTADTVRHRRARRQESGPTRF